MRELNWTDFVKDEIVLKEILAAVNRFIPRCMKRSAQVPYEPVNKKHERQPRFFSKPKKRQSIPRLGNADHDERVHMTGRS